MRPPGDFNPMPMGLPRSRQATGKPCSPSRQAVLEEVLRSGGQWRECRSANAARGKGNSRNGRVRRHLTDEARSRSRYHAIALAFRAATGREGTDPVYRLR